MPKPSSPNQLLTTLQAGQHGVICDPKQPGKIITQAARVADVYYITGPLFNDYTSIELKPLFEVAAANNDDEAATAKLLNAFLGDHGVPPEAHVHTCHSLPDALSTLAGLFAAY